MSSFPKTPLLPPRGHRARKLALIIISVAPFLFGALALFLGQDANWDLRNYHWYNAYAFINHRYDLDFLPSQTPFFYNPALDIPFYLFATHVPARVAGFVLGSVQGINFILLFMLAYAGLTINNPRQKVLACAGLAALGMLGGGGIALLGTTFYDNVTSLGLFTSALLVIRFRKHLFGAKAAKALGYALLCGVPCGLMMGLKLPIVIFCVGFCGALLFVQGDFLRRVWVVFGFGLGVLAGIAITQGAWMHYLQVHYQSPLFPYFNNIFQSPLAPISDARDMEYIQRNWHDRIFYPFIFADSPFRTGEIPFRDWRIPILYVLLPLAVILRLTFGRSKTRADAVAEPFVARYLLWAVSISYFAWLVMFCIYRYAIPLEMITPLLIVFATSMLPVKPQTRGLLAFFILLVVAASIVPGNWSRRAAWSDKFIEADVPAIDLTTQPMLLMAGFEPYSHIVTFFPPSVPVVRIQSNFASPDQNKAINSLIAERLNAHKGSFLMLIPPWQKPVANEALGYYHLALASQPCQKVIDRLYGNTELALCPVKRVPANIP